MEIWFLDFDNEQQGPYTVVAKDKNNYFIHHPEVKHCLLAVPKLFIVSTIEMETDNIPSVQEYVILDALINSIDSKYSDFVKIEH